MNIERNVSLAPHTTFKIGGPAAYFVAAASVADLRDALRFAKEKSLPFLVLGGGSNVLIDDEGLNGMVIQNKLTGVSFKEEGEKVFVTCGAGEHWDTFVASTVARGLYGLENLSGIPGSVGATPIQNVGAYGTEVADAIEWVEVYNTETGEIERLNASVCGFGYRDSVFKHSEGKRYIVTRVCFKLSINGNTNLSYKDLARFFEGKKMPTLQEVRSAVLEIRSKKFPDLNEYGTAGSFFKNPVLDEAEYRVLAEKFPNIPAFPQPNGKVKVSVAWLLDQLQLKGVCENNVCTFERQPLVVITKAHATACDVTTFTNNIAQQVKEKTNITLEPEVTFVKNKK